MWVYRIKRRNWNVEYLDTCSRTWSKMKTEFKSFILLYLLLLLLLLLFAMNIHQISSLTIVWRSLSKRIKFSHIISELKRSIVTPGSRNRTDENETGGMKFHDSAKRLCFESTELGCCVHNSKSSHFK
jgi:hypothetical protein